MKFFSQLRRREGVALPLLATYLDSCPPGVLSPEFQEFFDCIRVFDRLFWSKYPSKNPQWGPTLAPAADRRAADSRPSPGAAGVAGDQHLKLAGSHDASSPPAVLLELLPLRLACPLVEGVEVGAPLGQR